MKQAVNDQVFTAEAVTAHHLINMYFRLPLTSSGLFRAGLLGFIHPLIMVHHRERLGGKHPDFQTITPYSHLARCRTSSTYR